MPTPRLLRTSSFRLALVYAGLTGISFLVLFGVIFWSTTRFMRHQIDDSVASELGEILTDPQAETPHGLQSLVQAMTRHSPGFYYLLQDAQGKVEAGNLPAIASQEGVREWGPVDEPSLRPFANLRGRGVAFHGDYVFVGWSTHQLREMEEMVTGAFLWGLGASITLALAGGIVMSGRLLRKIEAVSETSRDIIRGDLLRRVPIPGAGDEFDHLAASINAMLDRIQTLMGDLQQVTTDIAHDLRTPLTRLRQRLEIAQQPQAEAATLRATLDATVDEIDAILGIFAALLRIAQVESGARRAAFTRINLSELVSTAAELYRPAAEEKGQSLVESIERDLAVTGDRELLLQLFANLLDNAVRHSPAGAHLAVAAAAAGPRATVSVTDDGEGIPEALRSRVLQRFVRLESSRTTTGHGLGLSLASAIAKLHGVDLVLTNRQPGLQVTVELPRAPVARGASEVPA